MCLKVRYQIFLLDCGPNLREFLKIVSSLPVKEHCRGRGGRSGGRGDHTKGEIEGDGCIHYGELGYFSESVDTWRAVKKAVKKAVRKRPSKPKVACSQCE